MNKQTQMITGTLAIVTTAVIGYFAWSFYRGGKGSSAPVVVVESA